MKLVFSILLLFVSSAMADEVNRRISWDGMTYGYASSMSLRGDSLLNPGNRIAGLPQNSVTAEARFNLKAESDTLRLTLRPILLAQDNRDGFVSQRSNEGYLSQWQLRLRAAEAWSIAAGREVLNWGPAQFRSPSSPFYFDNGRSNPMRELSGMDALKISWAPDMQRSLYVTRIAGSGHTANGIDPWRDSWLVKADTRGDGWAGGLALAKKSGRAAFLGAHGQFTASDALLVYGEAGSTTQPNALQSPSDAMLPFSVTVESRRHATLLAGMAYTFNNGQSLNAEVLHDGHGYSAQEESAYFARAAVFPLLAGQALAYAPRLLGRDYLHLVWQSNLMESDGYGRMMLTHNFTDNGDELSGYGEIALTARVTAFALGLLPIGSARQEFSSLATRSLTAGVKVALP